MSAERNLDLEPGFWLTVAILLPFMILVEIGCLLDPRVRRLK